MRVEFSILYKTWLTFGPFVSAIGTVVFETRFGSFSKSPSVEAAKFIQAAEKFFELTLQLAAIPAWIDKIYRVKAFQEFYDCMDVMHSFADNCIEKKFEEIKEKLENGDVQDEDAAEFLTFLIRRDDITSKEITANLLEVLMAAIETVTYCINYYSAKARVISRDIA